MEPMLYDETLVDRLADEIERIGYGGSEGLVCECYPGQGQGLLVVTDGHFSVYVEKGAIERLEVFPGGYVNNSSLDREELDRVGKQLVITRLVITRRTLWSLKAKK